MLMFLHRPIYLCGLPRGRELMKKLVAMIFFAMLAGNAMAQAGGASSGAGGTAAGSAAGATAGTVATVAAVVAGGAAASKKNTKNHKAIQIEYSRNPAKQNPEGKRFFGSR